jgi:hypothetical protein
MLHQKTDGVAAAAAAKTFLNFLGWRYGKRGSLFIVKGAQAKMISASFFQFYKTPDHINNIKAAEYLLYGILRNHYLFWPDCEYKLIRPLK